eukprot:CAMPEP_0179483838 /NCGR_PEP_ID=MMETSP0799-20121207/60901_1 /TAXON_ID=46947 /ORGANISM="Geminigera cryophila, Strain CCMP2564" /LENGTH=153 /DNA_ID=CAMNT_0021297515 /DNA_START=19 /DNA_END=482 /DNA_ORIENTATION=-
MPRAQTRWLGAAFEAPRLANRDAANMTASDGVLDRAAFRNPTKHPPPSQFMQRQRPAVSMNAQLEKPHVGTGLAAAAQTKNVAVNTAPTCIQQGRLFRDATNLRKPVSDACPVPRSPHLPQPAHAMANLSSRILLQQEARTHDKRSMHEHRDK